ncbi:hypothetical protein RJ641_020764 [Dillenia turbinata]|uniref:Uncharacterized protein n=1 Tax=Dillenia turbinata TaxID=194707 RepID=A0AAN8YWN6_9MAGN
MRRLFGTNKYCFYKLSNLSRVQHKSFCSTTTKNNHGKCNNSDKALNNDTDNKPMDKMDAYRQLENLDFMTAAKILFTSPPKKKFGLDFHLVQLFFVCMPSLAVYLVAQYARHEMRKMEKELEEKKKAEDEAKAKEMELNVEEERDSDPELLQVKQRLDALEETLKEIVVEKKKIMSSNMTKNQDGVNENKDAKRNGPGQVEGISKENNSAANDSPPKQSLPSSGHEKVNTPPSTQAFPHDSKGKT